MEEIIVMLERGVWLANWEGDPARTLKIDNAKRFKTKKAASAALKKARKYRPFIKGIVCVC